MCQNIGPDALLYSFLELRTTENWTITGVSQLHTEQVIPTLVYIGMNPESPELSFLHGVPDARQETSR